MALCCAPLTEDNQVLEFGGPQLSKLVLDLVSQSLPLQFRASSAEGHKKDAAGQWAVVIDMPTRPLNTPHVAPDVLHGMYTHVLWWAADLVATPQPKFVAGSPSHVKVKQVPAE